MKIPDAYFAGGFGHKVAQPQPIGGLLSAIDGQAAAAAEIGRAGQRLGGALFQLGVDELDGQRKLQEQRQAEEKKLRDARDNADAMGRMYAHKNDLSALIDEITADSEIPPEKYLETFQLKAEEIKSRRLDGLGELQQLGIRPALENHRFDFEKKIREVTEKKFQSQTMASVLSAEDELFKSPVYTLQQKIALVDDPNFWSGTGLAEDTIRGRVLSFSQKLYEADIAQRFNTEPPRQVKGYLETKGPNGEYSNLPGLDPLKREGYIAKADDEIKRVDAEALREAREAQSLRDQETSRFFETVKSALQDGYPLSAEMDVQARIAFKGTKYEPLFAEVRQRTGSFAFRQGLINKDPLLYHARQNGYNIPPLDLSNPATIPQQVVAREVFAAEAEAAFNLPYRPRLLADEVKAISGQLEKLDGPGRAQTAEFWGGLLGREAMTQYAAQIAGAGGGESAGNSALALEVALAANGKAEAAGWIGSGRDYLRSVKIPEPTRKVHDRVFDTLAGESMRHLGTAREDYRNAVNAAFIHLAKSRGLDVEKEINFTEPGFFSGGSEARRLYQQAFLAVVGETVKTGGKVTVVPSGMTPDAFLNSVKRIAPETIAQAGGVKGMTPAAAAARIVEDAKFLEMGDGIYAFELDGVGVRREDGKPLLLRFGQ